MYKRHLINGSISKSLYGISNKESVGATVFAEALARLAEEHLRGAVELSISGNSDGYTSLSLGTISELIRCAIAGISPDDVLKISLELTEDMKITLSAKRLPPPTALAHIITLAKSAGFTVRRDGESITLTAALEFSRSLSIYAISSDDVYKNLEYSFLFEN